MISSFRITNSKLGYGCFSLYFLESRFRGILFGSVSLRSKSEQEGGEVGKRGCVSNWSFFGVINCFILQDCFLRGYVSYCFLGLVIFE